MRGLAILQLLQYYMGIMTSQELKAGRVNAPLTQLQAALRLRISQPYLSQLESGTRPITSALARRAASVYRLPATTLPLPFSPTKEIDASKLAHQLASLGCPGFAHLRGGGYKANPAMVVLDALLQKNLETRLSEALPWVVATYPGLQWDWLVQQAKLNDIQNRLGFVVDLAKTVAQKSQHQSELAKLSEVSQVLERSLLAREDTLCRESMSEVERNWLAENRSPCAKRWNLLTGLAPEQLSYAA
jgi:transcriptional regulator with XRE-family HTH domain